MFKCFSKLDGIFVKRKLEIGLVVPAKYDCYMNDMRYQMKKYRSERFMYKILEFHHKKKF